MPYFVQPNLNLFQLLGVELVYLHHVFVKVRPELVFKFPVHLTQKDFIVQILAVVVSTHVQKLRHLLNTVVKVVCVHILRRPLCDDVVVLVLRVSQE